MSKQEAEELLRILKIRRTATKLLFDQYQTEIMELDGFIQRALTITDYKSISLDVDISPLPLDGADLAIRLLSCYLENTKREV